MAKTARTLILWAAISSLGAGATADEHLVPQAAIAEHLRAAAAEEEAGVEQPSPTAVQPLGSRELDDLGRRAGDLDTDPAATGAGHVAIGMALGAAITVLVIGYLVMSDPNY